MFQSDLKVKPHCRLINKLSIRGLLSGNNLIMSIL